MGRGEWLLTRVILKLSVKDEHIFTDIEDSSKTVQGERLRRSKG